MNNLPKYLSEMNLSMVDKLFYVNHIQPDFIADFGCADAAMLKALLSLGYTGSYYGIENNLDLIRDNTRKFPNQKAYFGSREFIVGNFASKNPTLVLSSVLHEIYSYLSEKEILEFWQWVNRCEFKYIVIRDMHAPNPILDDNLLEAVLDNITFDHHDEWVDEWGQFKNPKSLIHYILKYSYRKNGNWDRELKENYLSWEIGKVSAMLPYHKRIHYSQYTLPFLRDKVMKDFGVRLKNKTHIKAIYELDS